ncbi:uncharacterized protein LOC131951018 [Physella acuta]|uniref:uncharacterized protein LOC131951018 n=1 Tax=Physella acuta TaxID=109671 RepID=UPI0027DDCC2E|nr:uncharacterized protein LOC131951018 [Physella acuta]
MQDLQVGRFHWLKAPINITQITSSESVKKRLTLRDGVDRQITQSILGPVKFNQVFNCMDKPDDLQPYKGYFKVSQLPPLAPSIRVEEKEKIRCLLSPGTVLQVCGPPMAGKSVLVDQAIQEKQQQLSSTDKTGIVYLPVLCKYVTNLHDLLVSLTRRFAQQTTETTDHTIDADVVLGHLQKLVRNQIDKHYILAFHKCESLRTSGYDQEFLQFIARLARLWWDGGLAVSVVFTTYKYFPSPELGIELFQVGMLTKFEDILTLLKHVIPNKCMETYVPICYKFLCFPEGVVRIAEEYLANEEIRPSTDAIEELITKDMEFLSLLFSKRLDEVQSWVCAGDLELLSYFSSSLGGTFTEEHLKETFKGQRMRYADAQWQQCIKRLKNNHLICKSPGVLRWMVHPLIVYFFKLHKVSFMSSVHSHYFNSYTNFLCRVLMKCDTQVQGHKTYNCLLQEWPHVKHVLDMAIHSTGETYQAFLRVAVTARRLLVTCLPHEAEEFYHELSIAAQTSGNLRHHAVMQACLGYVISCSAGSRWTQATQYFDTALDNLRREGPGYFYKWTLRGKAILLHRQGHYVESLEFFKQAANVVYQDDLETADDPLTVTLVQQEADEITTEIHQTIPMIFCGDIESVRKNLLNLLDAVRDQFPHHPDLPVLLNNIGLTEERGGRDLDRALRWYELSYRERLQLEKLCPQQQLVSLNNIGMVLHAKGQLEKCKLYLQRALEIQKVCGWNHYNTALTLVHLGSVLFEAFQSLDALHKFMEADVILQKTAPSHDFRLSVGLGLMHYSLVALQEPDPGPDPHQEVSTHGPLTCGSRQSCSEYLDYLQRVCRELGHVVSVDGVQNLLAVYEHGILLSRCHQDYLTYRQALVMLVHGNRKLRDFFLGNSPSPADVSPSPADVTPSPADASLHSHRKFFQYVRTTEYQHLDEHVLLELIQASCLYCQQMETFYCTDLLMGKCRFQFQEPEVGFRGRDKVEWDAGHSTSGDVTQLLKCQSDASSDKCQHTSSCADDILSTECQHTSSCANDMLSTGANDMPSTSANNMLSIEAKDILSTKCQYTSSCGNDKLSTEYHYTSSCSNDTPSTSAKDIRSTGANDIPSAGANNILSTACYSSFTPPSTHPSLEIHVSSASLFSYPKKTSQEVLAEDNLAGKLNGNSNLIGQKSTNHHPGCEKEKSPHQKTTSGDENDGNEFRKIPEKMFASRKHKFLTGVFQRLRNIQVGRSRLCVRDPERLAGRDDVMDSSYVTDSWELIGSNGELERGGQDTIEKFSKMKANTSGVNECLHLEVADSEGHGDSCGTALCRRQQVTKTFSNIRRAERKMIRELLATGGVVQVFGPPMVGKASIVQQVVQELQMGSPEVKSHVIPSRHQTLSDVLNHLMSRICPNTVIDPEPDFNDSSNRERMVQEIRTSLNHDNHYLLVFKKCEGLKAAESEFLTWVGSLTDLWRSHDIKVSIILTTYKQFRMTRRDVSLVEVGVLTDADDISTLLQDTAPGVRDDQLIPVCRRSLCLPECVVTLARECVARECVAKECVARECVAKECVTKECVARECVAKECVAKECVAKESVARECVAINCLTNEATRLSTEMVELVVPTDSMFPDVFVARLMDVETWVSRDDLQLLLMPGQATFQPEALLEHVNCKHPDEKVKDLLHRYAYVIEPNRYRLHPLLTFYCHTFPILQAGTTSQRFTLGNSLAFLK